MLTNLLLGVAIALLVVLLVVTVRRRGLGQAEVEAAVSGSWIRLGLAERIGAVEEQAREIRDSYRSFEQLLRVPTERGSFGELSLDTILADQLPPEMYGIRQRIFDGKIPDASIRSTAGIICVDSKFPLDNYRRVVESDDPAEIEACRRRFLRDLRGHLAKVGEDYVRPEKGSADFAFAYIPSEAVYYYLLREGHDLLRDFARRGVQVVSPLTLATKIELIKAGVHAKRLSEGAQQVRDDLRALSQRFAALDGEWQILYGTHLSNAASKAGDVDRAYRALRQEFRRVAAVEEEGERGEG
ncbi:MAG: DNA recombination protein RmuC [Chloroflexi bacterium]|nr:DNA recombination protein RmuC [Chloroflexota bacterium]